MHLNQAKLLTVSKMFIPLDFPSISLGEGVKVLSVASSHDIEIFLYVKGFFPAETFLLLLLVMSNLMRKEQSFLFDIMIKTFE